MLNATSTSAVDIVGSIMRATLTTTEEMIATDWPSNDSSTIFETLNENDTFPMLMLPLSSGRHVKQPHIIHPEHFSPVLLSNEWRPLSRLVSKTRVKSILLLYLVHTNAFKNFSSGFLITFTAVPHHHVRHRQHWQYFYDIVCYG